MDRYEVFALLALACSMIAMIFCGFGLWYMVSCQDQTDGQLRIFRKLIFKERRRKNER